MMPKRYIFGLSISIILLLTSCSPEIPQGGNETPPIIQLPSEVTRSPTPLPRPAAETPPTTTPTNEYVPPFPDRPLDDTGPWLFFYESDQPQRVTNFYTANLDGTGITSVLPTTSSTDESGEVIQEVPTISAFALSPSGGYLALQTQSNATDIILWLIQLPRGEVIQTIPLLGTQAQEAIAEKFGDTYVSALWIKTIPISFLWSPNGRFLVISAAIDGPSTDIYIYDTETASLSRLTSGPSEAVLMGWSPDSRWIVHQAVSTLQTPFKVAEGVWAISVDGAQLNQLYIPKESATETIVGWTSPTTFINYSAPSGSPATQLREVDILSGSLNPILNAIFKTAFTAPESQDIFIDMYGFHNWNPEIIPGFYRFSPQTNQIDKFLPGGYTLVAWVQELGLFAAAERLANTQVIYLDTSGETHLILPRNHPTILWPIPSPDGEWLITPNDVEYQLYTNTGELIRSTPSLGQILWLPDSSGFLQLNVNYSINQYLLENDWEGQPLNPEFFLQGTFSLINP